MTIYNGPFVDEVWYGMLVTIHNTSDIDKVWKKMGFYCRESKLINRTLVVNCLLTSEEMEEELKDFDVKIRKLPTSYKF
jgi:hypothetical protein